MYCENCGTKIPEGSQFCPECGAPVHHEEESLISRARRGDNDAIHQLMNQYRGMVRYQARMYVKNEDDVNEIEQQVYIKAFSKTSDLADEKRFGGWLKTIAINTAKNYVTTAFRKRSVMFTDLDDTNNDMVYDARDERIDHRPEVQMDETVRQEIIMKVLHDLPQDQQDVIVMHFYNDLSFREIAEELGVPMSTVTGRAQMAKNTIKATVTEIQNREGIKLYHLSPIAFFIWLLGMERTAPVEPPVIGKTVRIDPQKIAAKDKPHNANYERNAGKTVKAEKAVKETSEATAKKVVKTTARTVAKTTAGKAAGAGFFATTAGKIIVAAAVTVAAVGGGSAAGIAYHKTHEEKQVQTERKNTRTVQVNRPTLLSSDTFEKDPDYTVSKDLNDYTLKSDFSNIINPQDIEGLSDDAKEKLLKNNFVVTGGNDEFYLTYLGNTEYTPNFVTVDSIMHTFHLYYAYLQKNLESSTLGDDLKSYSTLMAQESEKQLASLKATDYEKAAQINSDYFNIARSLFGEKATLSDKGKEELALINAAEEVKKSPLFGYTVDYSQFKPRGYYTESDTLKKYFRVMQWYGQMTFLAKNEDQDRSTVLMIAAMNNDALKDWENVYLTTAFFAGESDDNGYYEYQPLVKKSFGDVSDVSELKDQDQKFDQYVKDVKSLKAPKINSMLYDDQGEDTDVAEETRGFRVMGQRFSIDGNILNQLIYPQVKKNDQNQKRKLPDPLDVPAAFGNDEALKIAEDNGASSWPDYEKQMKSVRKSVNDTDSSQWSSSVSSSWLYTLKPIVSEKDKSYPEFMQNGEWAKKDISSFLSGYTELKHDTVLYAKPMGGGLGDDGVPDYDDRGYVEPQPEVYARLSALCKSMVKGLQSRNLISSDDAESVTKIGTMADKLENISIEELSGKLPSDDEFNFIRYYGSDLESLWEKTILTGGNESTDPHDHPAALVTDLSMDADSGKYLEIASGKPMDIYVAVYFDNEIRIARGVVWSFYTWQGDDRMTDEEWRKKVDDTDNPPEHPEWTDGFIGDDPVYSYQ